MQIDQGFADVNGTRRYDKTIGSGHPLVLMRGFTLDALRLRGPVGEAGRDD